MSNNRCLFAAAPFALMFPGFENAANAARVPAAEASVTETQHKAPDKKPAAEAAFAIGVAKGGYRLDSATSTSAVKGSEIEKFGAHLLPMHSGE